MKTPLLTLLTIVTFCSVGFSQIRYSGKIEAGYFKYGSNIITVDPGPEWKGYYLEEEQNGVGINVINGINFKEKGFTGIGIGYVNFAGTNGISLFSDLEYIPLKKRISPLLNTKIGYSHIWNQYENGTGTVLVELGAGLRYKLTERTGIYLQSGILFMQQSALFPFKLGLNF